ncbi:MAG: DUF6600 domain-containing protein [Burkholderiales bacterium]
MKLHTIYTAAALAVALFAGVASADPPARVGRLSLVEGAVSFSVGGEGGNDNWSASKLNWPITEGNRLYADSGSRAEVNIGASSLRLTEKTAVEFVRFDDQRIEADLTQGSLNLTLKNWDRGDDFIVTTPTLRVTFNHNGRYRISVSDAGEAAMVAVRQGEAQVVNGRSRFNIIAPQQATLNGGDGEQVNIVRANAEDDFERWAADRDRRQEVAYSSRYVAPDTLGLYELDRYGNWRDVGDYGPVWVPSSVAVGWAPYRYGHWAWVAPWGWTWVDEAPWGFTPFHYGRWVYLDSYWAWAPGRIIARPVYAPALVSFISAPGFSVSVNIGNPCGWIPLAPREAYYPYYQTSQTYVRSINVSHVNVTNVNVTNVNVVQGDYRNRHAPGGVTLVAPNVMLGSLPVARAVLPVERHILRDIARIAPPLPPLPLIGASVPRPVFARPEGRDARDHRDNRDRSQQEREERRRPEHKFQTGAGPVPQAPVIERERPRPINNQDNGRDQDRNRDERRRPPRADVRIPPHEVDTRVPFVEPAPVVRSVPGPSAPLPMPGNVIRDAQRERPVIRPVPPSSAPLPIPSNIGRDAQRPQPARPIMGERPDADQGQDQDSQVIRRASPGMVQPR